MNPYRCTFQMGMEKALEYRVNFVLSLLSAVFPIVIQTFLGIICMGIRMLPQ